MSLTRHHDFVQAMHRVLQEEIAAIQEIERHFLVDVGSYVAAVELIRNATNRITTGMGTSGLLARKLAASLTSIGYPSYFVHPSDAEHGNIGYVTSNTCCIAFSNSGSTRELVNFAQRISELREHTSLILISREVESTLGQMSDVVIKTYATIEADYLGLVPTSSAICTLAAADVLVSGLEFAGEVSRATFHRNHPSGALGTSLSLTFGDVMTNVDNLRCLVDTDADLGATIAAMSLDRFGACLVKDGHRLEGIFTDGDLRRLVERSTKIDLTTLVQTVMTDTPQIVQSNELVVPFLQQMEKWNSKITVFPVVQDDGTLLGLCHLHDILRREI